MKPDSNDLIGNAVFDYMHVWVNISIHRMLWNEFRFYWFVLRGDADAFVNLATQHMKVWNHYFSIVSFLEPYEFD